MKNIPLPIIAWFIAKSITTVWGKRVHLVRSFQERLSELGMGRFIAHYEQRDITKGQLESFMEMLISAYLCIITVPAILSVYGKEVMETEALDGFFQKYTDYNVWRTVKEKMAEAQYIDMPKKVILETIIEQYNMPELKPRIEHFLHYPWELMRCILGSIWDVIESLGMDVGKIVDHVNQRYQTYRFAPWMGLLPPMFWRVVHPTLDLDWAVIKSYIAMLESYRLMRGYKDYAGFIDPFLTGQVVKIMYDDKVKAYEHLGEKGLVKLSIPYDDVEEKITLDTFGLKIDIPKQPKTFIAFWIPEENRWVSEADGMHKELPEHWYWYRRTEWELDPEKTGLPDAYKCIRLSLRWGEKWVEARIEMYCNPYDVKCYLGGKLLFGAGAWCPNSWKFHHGFWISDFW